MFVQFFFKFTPKMNLYIDIFTFKKGAHPLGALTPKWAYLGPYRLDDDIFYNRTFGWLKHVFWAFY